ncbi:hypothetical protein ACFQT0_00975 [Hymenobacter humi]|uniref:Uncharacterized protein n=1 Tax=Hymenobacter humi TaxID=1411620 RepID=A0ABW2TY40_9BACT
MKSLLKFTLLSALIISGKLAKQNAAPAVAQSVETTSVPDTSLVFEHQVIPAEPAKSSQDKAQLQPSTPDLLANLF